MFFIWEHVMNIEKNVKNNAKCSHFLKNDQNLFKKWEIWPKLASTYAIVDYEEHEEHLEKKMNIVKCSTKCSSCISLIRIASLWRFKVLIPYWLCPTGAWWHPARLRNCWLRFLKIAEFISGIKLKHFKVSFPELSNFQYRKRYRIWSALV